LGGELKAIILAAGYATRLYPLTLNIPKPLLHVTPEKTVIDFIVDDLSGVRGIDEVLVVTNHKFYPDFIRWSAKRKLACTLTVLDDGTMSNLDRLGAVGDIVYAVNKKRIDSDLIVIGGDNLFDRGFKDFFNFAFSKRPYASLGVFDIKDKKDAAQFGVVSVDPRGRVISFEEKPARPRSSCVATCLYFFPKDTLRLLHRYAADPKTIKDAPGNYIRWLMQKSRVYGSALGQGHWHDIGHFDSYKEVVNRYNRS